MAPILDTSAFSDKLNGLLDKVQDDKKSAVAAGAALVLGGALVWRACSSSNRSSGEYKRKPNVFELSGGSIDRGNVKNEWDNYEASYGKEAGAGITDRSKVTQLVDVFYSLVTDIYEWGWGQSFHFSPKLPGKDWAASEAAHEARIAATLGLRPGMKCLDVGCGVGGPMRTIAAVSGAHVTGITINQYQVGPPSVVFFSWLAGWLVGMDMIVCIVCLLFRVRLGRGRRESVACVFAGLTARTSTDCPPPPATPSLPQPNQTKTTTTITSHIS